MTELLDDVVKLAKLVRPNGKDFTVSQQAERGKYWEVVHDNFGKLKVRFSDNDGVFSLEDFEDVDAISRDRLAGDIFKASGNLTEEHYGNTLEEVDLAQELLNQRRNGQMDMMRLIAKKLESYSDDSDEFGKKATEVFEKVLGVKINYSHGMNAEIKVR